MPGSMGGAGSSLHRAIWRRLPIREDIHVRAIILACGLIACAMPITAQAQTTNEDVRCLLLSASFARIAKDDNSRRASAMTGAFYLGRVNGRLSGPALSAAIRAQGSGLPAKQAEPIMRACAARAAAAERELSVAVKQVQPSK